LFFIDLFLYDTKFSMANSEQSAAALSIFRRMQMNSSIALFRNTEGRGVGEEATEPEDAIPPPYNLRLFTDYRLSIGDYTMDRVKRTF